ncbi:hypothetical protein ACMZ7J_03895 [Gardnerella greenwoodii]|uniref:hypothetical protein n=1 Tax=Gardnerella greenwoodii TaxID=2914925 RepID=UPI0039F14C97
MKKNNAFLYYCVSTLVLICMLTAWVVYVRFTVDTVQNSGFSLNHVASNTISAITKPHTRNTDDILSQAGKEYKNVLENSSYVSNNIPQDSKYYYDLWDIDNDTIPEMVIISADEFNSNTTKHIKVFSFKNGKLVKYPEIIDNAHDENENSGTIYFDPHHKGIVILRAIEKNSPDVFPWSKTIYKLNEGNFTNTRSIVYHPLDKDNTYDPVPGTGEISKLLHPTFVSVDDFTDINMMINAKNLTQAQRKHNKLVQLWREKGYQVFTGTVKILNVDEAYDFPGTTPNNTGKKDNVLEENKDNIYTVLVLDRKMSVGGYCNGTDCGVRQTFNSLNNILVTMKISKSNESNRFEKYNKQKNYYCCSIWG